jgi:CubicO group peptidase (beta-lactamase class C family)
MNKHLFTPLGMTSTQLVLDKTGVWVGGVGANSTPRDFARFGWLFANNCIWNGDRILSSGWCDFAARSAKTTAEYGSHWWKLEPGTLSALGIYGQAIVVNEKLETVVVVNSSPGSEQDRGFELALSLVREISPSANS